MSDQHRNGDWYFTRMPDAHGNYVDYDMHRHCFHDVRLTWDQEDGAWYALLRVSLRSEGPYGDFGAERQLPDAIVEKLRKIVGESNAGDAA